MQIFELIDAIEKVVSPGGVLRGEDVAARSDTWTLTGSCQASAIIRPANTDEVSQVLKLCHAAGQNVVTHGGLTGLVGGAKAGKDDIALSLERMNRVEAVDAVNRTLTVEAGAPLQKVHEAAEAAGLLFPLDLGARGSCTIGGNISTNAGGNSVIRYGMMREQLLGLEAVLADGTIISSLKGVIKNNTGYDLKQLFVGSEGTLGIVTRAVLRLRPLPRSCNTALVAMENFEQVAGFLGAMDSALGGTLSAFEVLWNDFYQAITAQGSRHSLPLAPSYPFYVLLESTGGHQESDGIRFEAALEEAFNSELIVDAVIAQYPPIVFDVSLGIPDMAGYVEEVRNHLKERWPQSRMVAFGHIGDGNIHLVITVGSLEEAHVQGVESIVYELLERRHGVISAEHGIGLEKRAYLKHSRSDVEIALMKTLKRALDPKGILNRGKIFE